MFPASNSKPLNYRLFAKFAEGDLEIMKYDIGSIVVLTSGRTVYITNYNVEEAKLSLAKEMQNNGYNLDIAKL